MGDIFTRKDGISGLKSSSWAGLGKLVNTPLDSSTFGIWYHNLQYGISGSIYIADVRNRFAVALVQFIQHPFEI
jgi:hypothetical protein